MSGAIKALVFDMDGVLWRDNKPITGSAEATQKLVEAGRRLFYLTNNSSHSRYKLSRRLQRFGFACDGVDHIITSASLIAIRLRADGVTGKVLVFGSEALYDEVSSVEGVTPVGILGGTRAQGDVRHIPMEGFSAIALGFDMRTSYSRIATAVAIANETGCKIYCSNVDGLCPHSDYVLPGTGNLLKPITCSLRAHNEVVYCGKPEKTILQLMSSLDGIASENILMVGDNLDTDIAFGKVCKMQTLLVESGLHSRAEAANRKVQPDFIATNLAAFVEKMLAS